MNNKAQGSHLQLGFNSPSQDGTHQAPPPKNTVNIHISKGHQ